MPCAETCQVKMTYSKETLFREYLLRYLFGIVSEKGLPIMKAKLS
jgi:hypothetical protein